ncbi:MAG: hypothetical protein EP329_28670 [Deltaproteobacteria bacterium]|nr:MAG: hypothetical protein EP329_28670 [Deltaproteobacteria bacterium]
MGIFGRARTLLATAFTAAVVVGACAAPDEGVEVAVHAAPQTDRFAVVTLTYSDGDGVGDADGVLHDQLVSQAYFVEHRGIDRADVLRLLSSPLDGLVDPGIPVDACVVEERDVAAADVPDDTASVRLLDAGELMLDTGAGTSMLDSHYFPEMYSAVGGLAYDGLLYDSHAFAFDRPLTVSADGSDEVGELSVTLEPPPVVHLHSVGGAPPRHAHAWLPDDGGLEVTWDGAAGRPSDQGAPYVVVRYARRGFDHLARVTCVAADDGGFTIPEAALALLPDLGADQTDRVLVERIHAVPFSGPGMPDGLAVAIASDAVVLE